MGKKWIRCDTFLQENEDVLPGDCINSILDGKIDVYTETGRKLIDISRVEIKGPSTRLEIEASAAEYAKALGSGVMTKIGPTPDRVFEPKSPAKSEAINVRIECMRGIYYFIYPTTSILGDFSALKKLINSPTKDLQIKELAKFMFKYEDAVRCFGPAPADDAPAPVAVEKETAVVEISVYDPTTASHPDKVREAARLEIENRKLPKERRLKQAGMAKKVLGTEYGHQDPTRQYRALRDEAIKDGLLPPK